MHAKGKRALLFGIIAVLGRIECPLWRHYAGIFIFQKNSEFGKEYAVEHTQFIELCPFRIHSSLCSYVEYWTMNDNDNGAVFV